MTTRRASAAHAVVLCAVAAFAVTQLYLSERIGVWSEEVSTYPSGPNRAVGIAADRPPALDSCAGRTRLRTSDFRPFFALCAGGRTWPIVGASYYATWMYWPVAAPLPHDVFLLRKLGVALGLWTLLLGFAIARRLADTTVATACVAVAALSSPFVIAHAVLIHFEIVQLPLVMTVVWLAWPAANGTPPSSRRVAVLGLVAGLAVAVNVKSLFLLGPLGILAWRCGRWPALSRRGALILLTTMALPLVPMLAVDAGGAHSGLTEQVGMRLQNAAARLASGSAWREPLNCLRFWTDVASYGDPVDRAVGTRWVTSILPASSLAYVTVHFVRALARRTYEPLAAAVGALLASYVLLAAVLWTQQPAANYAPLHAVFGFATGLTVVALARWVARRASWPVGRALPLAVALTVLAVLGAAWNTFRHGDPARIPLGTNAVAQRAAVRFLATHAGAPAVTATYNLAGVVDGVSGGRIQATHLAPSVTRCGTADAPTDDLRACLEARLGVVVRRLGALRLLVPASAAVSDEREAALLVPVLQTLAARGDITVVREATFRGVGTGPLLELWDVRPVPGAAPPPAPPPTSHREGCMAHVSAANTSALYAALPQRADADGCELDEVSGGGSQIRLTWLKGGVATAAVVVTPTVCAPAAARHDGTFTAIAPASVEQSCPTAIRTLREVVRRGALGEPSGSEHRRSRWGPVRAGLILAVTAAALFAIGALVRRRRAR